MRNLISDRLLGAFLRMKFINHPKNAFSRSLVVESLTVSLLLKITWRKYKSEMTWGKEFNVYPKSRTQKVPRYQLFGSIHSKKPTVGTSQETSHEKYRYEIPKNVRTLRWFTAFEIFSREYPWIALEMETDIKEKSGLLWVDWYICRLAEPCTP